MFLPQLREIGFQIISWGLLGAETYSKKTLKFTASDGALVQPSFKSDPKTYITTVGLYNDSNELLAVAKLSKPILKSFSREAIIKVKLDY